MTEHTPASDPILDPAPPVAAPVRTRTPFWPWLLVLVIALAASAWAWHTHTQLRDAQQGRDAWKDSADTLQRSLDTLGSELNTLRDRQRSLDGRLTDSGANQRILREEVLGIGERAALLEDALARLAQTRQEGAQAMLLDEAEFLLLTGEERLHLFGDTAAAVRAFTLADAALGGLHEPIYATLRHTLAQEIAALRTQPADPRPTVRADVTALLATTAQLPSPDDRPDTTTERSRLVKVLDQIITVRRLDASGAPLSPMAQAARRSALNLQLRLALAAYEAGDVAAWSTGLKEARTLAAPLFDTEDARTQDFLSRLDTLAEIGAPSPPPALGATLRELRGLRATRRLGAQRAAQPIDTPPTTTVEQAPTTAEESTESAPSTSVDDDRIDVE